MLFMPFLIKAWSSTRSSRAGAFFGVPWDPSACTIGFLLVKRHLGHDGRSGSRLALDPKVAPYHGDPLSHARDANPLSRASPSVRHLSNLKASPPVSHLEPD